MDSVLKPHEIKSKNETYSFVSLKELTDVINSCAKIIATHICHCMLCKKTFNFKEIDQHTCSELSELEYIKPKENYKQSSKSKPKTRSKNMSAPKTRSTNNSAPRSLNRKKKNINRRARQK